MAFTHEVYTIIIYGKRLGLDKILGNFMATFRISSDLFCFEQSFCILTICEFPVKKDQIFPPPPRPGGADRGRN